MVSITLVIHSFTSNNLWKPPKSVTKIQNAKYNLHCVYLILSWIPECLLPFYKNLYNLRWTLKKNDNLLLCSLLRAVSGFFLLSCYYLWCWLWFPTLAKKTKYHFPKRFQLLNYILLWNIQTKFLIRSIQLINYSISDCDLALSAPSDTNLWWQFLYGVLD